MNISKVGSALSNPTRVKLLKLLAEGPLTATSAHKLYESRYESKHRESIYRELENLVDAGFVNKKYNNQEQSLLYYLHIRDIYINIENSTLEVNTDK